ncbi:AAA family ATPase [Anaerobacillus isosaccharinicus]|uniref:AAA family ATPase n=1 Tax=Anaerobacillus isosaccharinicus TaxID=1532552 RepID=A0A1S2LP73_9BACI|nr:AAA family ATPase [Anaerobacillus isosaccharinicus]MBA5583989.1 AAA family ATPase [Anaerobacillus isosaccharinicus]QOY37594.1 AAA family ATPase [Anaerobacillus isosaccharinicus]
MKLTKLILNNYRSFGPNDTIINISDLTAFIGHNSSGKTAVLSALQKLFGDSKIISSDFYIPLDKKSDESVDNHFYIEAYFEFFDDDGEVAEEDDYGIAHYFENFIVEHPGGNPYIVIRLDASFKKGSSPEGIIDYKYHYVVNKGEDGLKPISAHDRDKIKVIYIPAVRNPSEQLKNATGTILWRILKQINWKQLDKEKINEKIEELDKEVAKQSGVAIVKKIVSSQWKNYHNDSRYNEANIKFGSSDLDVILKKLEVEFSPSHTEKAFKVDDLGDGLKSLFYLTLIDSLLELENEAIKEIKIQVNVDERVLNIDPPALTLILVEEPENHVSPHLLGKVIKNLKNIRSRNNSQVLITSHSPSIIKRIDPKEVRHLRIDNGKTIIKEIVLPEKQDEAYKYVKEAIKAYPELYFSSLVVLGEGDSEEILIPRFLRLYIDDLDTLGISVVPLGGRHVNHFWKLLNQLDIPFITLLDLDKEREGGGWGRIKYSIKQLIENGTDKNEVLLLADNSILEDSRLEEMHTWEDYKYINGWRRRLEVYNVYFSSPLDIDFLMIRKFLDYYLMTLEKNEGPLIKINEHDKQKRIHELTDEEKQTIAYQERIEGDVKRALKEKGGEGHTYSKEQKESMIWYSYFFLTRGKPVTHLQALNYITDENLKVNVPKVFTRIAEKVKLLL